MIERVLTGPVYHAECFGDRMDAGLFLAEEAAISNAVARRRAEFVTVRACARDALSQMGTPAAPLLPGKGGAPEWPIGVVGSMTHCTGYRAAVVAKSSAIRTIGVDAEVNETLPSGVLEEIARPGEAEALPRSLTVAFDRVLFSAKESVYKAWFPLAKEWLDFHQAHVDIRLDGTFEARVFHPDVARLRAAPMRFSGLWAANDRIVLTGIVVRHGIKTLPRRADALEPRKPVCFTRPPGYTGPE